MFGVDGGFDVVIGNPPYVSHDQLTDGNYYKREYSDVWSPFADIYCFFAQRGILLLRTGGILTIITSNSYIKADYGKSLRMFLGARNTIKILINIERSQVFSSAIVNTAILVVEKSNHSTLQKTSATNSSLDNNSLEKFIKEKAIILPSTRFESSHWILESEDYLLILDKINKSGKSLVQYGAKIRLGIATGDNKSFILTENERVDFIKKNKKNNEILKPILRGRDIFRYTHKQPYEYVILSKNGVNLPAEYPDLAKHLEKLGDSFKQRGAKGQNWWNLRACDFYDDFKKEKIVWIELTDKGRFSLCKDEIYCINSAYFMLSPDLFDSRYLLALLNSKIINFYVKNYAETSGMGTIRWINNIVSNIPIPEKNLKQQKPFIDLVDKIIALKAEDSQADTSALERQIDNLVYRLYNLTWEEVKVIEPEFPFSKMEYEGVEE
jgi:hypothetical protein